ncbi:hypothetical protein HYY73_03815 [Candidatus Woesearchaeota archaeon]|nr:hypothetical protein [Candidatus Woesearchaeota archaeon]
MGARNIHKVQRSRDKAMLRQLSYELNSVFGELKRARAIGAIAVAEELTGNYNSARENYGSALELLRGIETAIQENPSIGETLADVVEEELKHAREGLKSKQLSDTVVLPEYLQMGTKLYKTDTNMSKLLNN